MTGNENDHVDHRVRDKVNDLNEHLLKLKKLLEDNPTKRIQFQCAQSTAIMVMDELKKHNLPMDRIEVVVSKEQECDESKAAEILAYAASLGLGFERKEHKGNPIYDAAQRHMNHALAREAHNEDAASEVRKQRAERKAAAYAKRNRNETE